MFIPTATPPANCRAGLQWCLARSGWNPADWECSATNPTSNWVLTILDDVFGDPQGSVPILLSLLHAPQALNQELWSEVSFLWSSTAVRRRYSENSFTAVPFAASWPSFSAKYCKTTYDKYYYHEHVHVSYSLSNTSLTSQITRSLSNRACLGYDRKVTAYTRDILAQLVLSGPCIKNPSEVFFRYESC
ncbi:hypothetical protein TNCV_4252401 [Trichonephila clavipes]|nr:hypothetical protein TNCV_4252401 [Trichonephila clavipes]